MSIKVRDIMTEPVLTCTPDTSLAVAAERMRGGDCGVLPVVDAQGRLAGIITDRDICMNIAASHRSALNIAVHEAMTQKVTSAAVDDDARSALMGMKAARVRRLPVCAANGQVMGLVSIEDVIIRGLSAGAVSQGDVLDALHAMFVRLPVTAAVADDGFTPG
jgi:CBS domain-containing protein